MELKNLSMAKKGRGEPLLSLRSLLVIANACQSHESSTMPSPLVQDLMTESIAFVITACPAFMAGLNASTENCSGDQGDDDKESVLGHGASGDGHCKAKRLIRGGFR